MSEPWDFATLIQQHQAGIWRYLRVLGCGLSEAEDLTQETFLAVFQKPFEIQSKAATRAYLRKVAKSQYLMSLRKTGRSISLEELNEREALWDQWSPEDEGDLMLIALESCLSQLPERTQKALKLQYHEHCSRQEIADTLELSPDGTKNLLQRAKQSLKQCIERKLRVFSERSSS
ncbi:RNA polymerase sigma factor [Planctomycetales bacterium 10988]|nr:RNA polymerase sigma factor [Planctomycetales bacterium 10988]